MSENNTIVIGACIKGTDSSGTEGSVQVVMYHRDKSIYTFVRTTPVEGTRPRWTPGLIGDEVSEKDAIATIEAHIARKMLAATNDPVIHGVYTVEMTEHDVTELDSGVRQPNSLFTRVASTLTKEPPKSVPKKSYAEVAQYMRDALRAVDDPDALRAYTEDALASTIESIEVPEGIEVTPDELEHGIVLRSGLRFFSYENEMGINNVVFLRTCRAAGAPVFMSGEPGTGKTDVFLAAFPDGHVFTWGESSTLTDVKGGFGISNKPGEYPWRDGPLLKAVISGTPHLGDELPNGDPRVVVEAYYTLMTHGYVAMNEYPEHPYAEKMIPAGGYEEYVRTTTENYDAIGLSFEERTILSEEEWLDSLDWGIKARPGFFIVFAGNPNTPGAVLSEALLSRCTVKVEYQTNYDAALRIIGPEFADIVTVARNMEAKRQGGEVSWAPQMRDLLAYRTVTLLPLPSGGGQRLALANLLNNCASEQDREVLEDVIARTMGVTNLKPFRI